MATKVVWEIKDRAARIERLESQRAWLLAAKNIPASTKVQLLLINEQQLDEARQG